MLRKVDEIGRLAIGTVVLGLPILSSNCSNDDSTTLSASGASDVVGSCSYDGRFSGLPECREFIGAGWTEDQVVASCKELGTEAKMGARCSASYALGTCTLDETENATAAIYTYGDDGSLCDAQKLGCETFGGGAWTGFAVCESSGGGAGGGGNIFIQPTRVCRDPIGGEPAGQGPNGQVCTWQAISGSTEQGRRFADYASCDVVRTQRPYWAGPPAEGWDTPDPRMNNPAYVADVQWVRDQVNASGCSCCHAASLTPSGPSNWDIETPGNWVNTFHPSGLALGANWVGSAALGAYPPQDNNGFERETSGLPSTDPERMRNFFRAELAHRGYSESDFAQTPPFGGPLVDQIAFKPGSCAEERVEPDGTIRWTGGPARYLYVLAANASNPTVPPNLDLPDGTLWRVDTPADGEAMQSGKVRYGEVPPGLTQRYPTEGSPAPLQAGTVYYLYVTKDVGIPITRCLFTY